LRRVQIRGIRLAGPQGNRENNNLMKNNNNHARLMETALRLATKKTL
jgi:hypothetical protein